MFEIEEVGERMVRIDDTYIPAVNIQVDGFPKRVDGYWYPIYFELMWEYLDCYWTIHRDDEDAAIVVLQVMEDRVKEEHFVTNDWRFLNWTEFKEFFEYARKGNLRGNFMAVATDHLPKVST